MGAYGPSAIGGRPLKGEGRALGLAFVAMALALAGCSGAPGPEEFVEALQEARPDLATADAECVVEELRQDFTDSELTELIRDAGEDAPLNPAQNAQFATSQFDAVRTCDLENQVSPELAQSFSAVNGVDAATAECAVGRLQAEIGFWELTDRLIEADTSADFQQRQFEAIFDCGDRRTVASQLVPQLLDQGLGESEAECAAEAMAQEMTVEELSVLYTGQITDGFFSLYFEALQKCDALPD